MTAGAAWNALGAHALPAIGQRCNYNSNVSGASFSFVKWFDGGKSRHSISEAARSGQPLSLGGLHDRLNRDAKLDRDAKTNSSKGA